MHPRLFYGLKCIKEGAANKFRGFKAPKNYSFHFWRMNNIETGTIDNFTGSTTLSKVKAMY